MRLSGDAAIANCHKVGRDGAAATGGACVRKLLLKVLLYSMGDGLSRLECDHALRPEAREAMAAAWDLPGNPRRFMRGPPVPPMGRAGQEQRRQCCWRRAPKRRLHVRVEPRPMRWRWHRGSAGFRPSGPKARGLGHRARFSACGRPVPHPGDGHHRRNSAPACWISTILRAGLRAGLRRWCR